MNKPELRKKLRARRAALSASEQRQAARAMASRAVTLKSFRAGKRLACYMANGGEIDPSWIIEHIWQTGKHCYLPVISHLNGGNLWFAPFLPDTRLSANRYGIPEPEVDMSHWVKAQALDLIFVPLVGFDRNGNRLGMGAGFYDRSLQFLAHRRHWKRPMVIGLGYDFQHVDIMKPDPWDITMQGVVTDVDFYPSLSNHIPD